MENVASSLTNLALDLDGHLVSRKVHIEETYVNVRWPWFILPVLLEAAGLFLFLATASRTRKRGTVFWQSSLLPLLFGGIEQANPTEPLTDLRRSELETRARRTTGQLLYHKSFQHVASGRDANG